MKATRRLSFRMLKVSVMPLFVLALEFWLYSLYAVYIKNRVPESLQHISGRIFMVIITVTVTYFLGKVISGAFAWYGEKLAARTASKLDDEFLPLFAKISSIAIWTIAMILLLSKMGFNISALVATLGVGSLAIALAAQDTIANIISGFLIMIDRPFKIGDSIKLPSGEKVTVLDIGVRRSKFVAEDKSVIIVPNVDLSKSKIINYSYGKDLK